MPDRRLSRWPLWLAMVFLSFPAGQVCASPAVIDAIRLTGNTAFTSRQILEQFSSRPGLVFSADVIASDVSVLLQRYRGEGYLDAHARVLSLDFSPDSARVSITLRIDEGRQCVAGEIRLEGVKIFAPEEVLRDFTQARGSELDEEALEEGINRLLDRYERAGYPFALCSIRQVSRRQGPEADSLDVTLLVEEGNRVAIDEIVVRGNSDTKSEVVVRETRLTAGEAFDPAKVNAIRRRLQRLEIFSEVSEPELYTRGGRGGLLIRVREGRTNTFDGVVGYVPPPSSGENGYLTGLLSLSMRNLFGTGRKAGFRWQREERNTQELQLRYAEPWVLGMPFNLGIGFLQRQQDTSYVRRVLSLKGELMLSEEFSASGVFSSETVIPSAGVALGRVFRSSTTSVGAEVLYDSRDDNLSPTSGARYRTEYSIGTKRLKGIPEAFAPRVPQRVVVQQFSVDLDFFLAITGRQILACGLHGRELRSGRLEEAEMFRMGGARSLRGYREGQFLGSRVVWGNAEYRLLVARRSFLFGFVDMGYYLRPAEDVRGIPKADGFKPGYGLGVQVETGLGFLGVSFALGQGDSFTQGKVHVGLINDF